MENMPEKYPVHYPRVGRVNLLYLTTLVLVALVGGLMQFFSASWGLLATEFILILAPALLFVHLSGLPWRATLRWRRPTIQAGGLSLLAGLGLAPVGMWLAGITAAVLGYAPLLTPDFFPRTPGQAVLIFLGLAVAAPLCEEVLFRGVIQRGYERFGPKIAILSTGILFIFFHLSFFRIWAIWPIAFVLCFLA
ncbi:MAG TPA: CPBP family intramembrane glutamic endopeptidase, partial [Anaerolineales bacterium]|nr:CPBP family intramembrane glutamic endopeptidase [Anaerolineales bacterium]